MAKLAAHSSVISSFLPSQRYPPIYIAGKKVQRGGPLPPRLHGEDGVRVEEEEIAGGVHEGPDRVGPVPRGQKRLLQLQAFAAEYEDANTGREAVLKYARLVHAEAHELQNILDGIKI